MTVLSAALGAGPVSWAGLESARAPVATGSSTWSRSDTGNVRCPATREVLRDRRDVLLNDRFGALRKSIGRREPHERKESRM